MSQDESVATVTSGGRVTGSAVGVTQIRKQITASTHAIVKVYIVNLVADQSFYCRNSRIHIMINVSNLNL